MKALMACLINCKTLGSSDGLIAIELDRPMVILG
jgi:hypothetical protein